MRAVEPSSATESSGSGRPARGARGDDDHLGVAAPQPDVDQGAVERCGHLGGHRGQRVGHGEPDGRLHGVRQQPRGLPRLIARRSAAVVSEWRSASTYSVRSMASLWHHCDVIASVTTTPTAPTVGSVRARDRAAPCPGHRPDAVHPAGRRALGDRRRGRAGAGRVRRAGLLPGLGQAEPGHRHQRGLPAAHPRGRSPVGARARLGEHVPDRGVPVADARADPAPALLLQPALPALRARAGRRDGRARGDRRGPGAARGVPGRDRGRAGGLHASCWAAWRSASPTSPTPPCGASRPGRRPARCCRPPPRRGSSSPATTAPGGTSSRCGPASTPTSRSASWPSPACASCSGWPATSSATSGSARWPTAREVAASPVRHRGLGRDSSVPGRTPRARGGAPIDTQYEDLLRRVLEQRHAEGRPHRHRHGQPVRRAAALRPVRAASR